MITFAMTHNDDVMRCTRTYADMITFAMMPRIDSKVCQQYRSHTVAAEANWTVVAQPGECTFRLH